MTVDKSLTELYEEVGKLARNQEDGSQVLEGIAELLYREVDRYDWVGFYLADDQKEELTLGPFAGEPTEHRQIDYGEGICGQAAETKATFTIQDVEKEENYLSCSPKVKSEIVVPVFEDRAFVGEIDIDSHQLEAFGPEDENFLENLAEDLSSFF